MVQPVRDAHHQPSIEDIDDEDTQPHKAVPKKVSHILKLADGSEDNINNDDMPGLMAIDDTDEDHSGDDDDNDNIEVPAESTEAELSKCLMTIHQKYYVNDKLRTTFEGLELTNLCFLQAHPFN